MHSLPIRELREEIRMALRGQGKPKPVEARNATSKKKPYVRVSEHQF